MAHNQHPTVPSDMWVCCSCNGGNLIANSDAACPVCGHYRNTCCIGPGEQYSMSTITLYSSHHHLSSMPYFPTTLPPHDLSLPTPHHSLADAPDDTWYCSECGALNLDHYSVCPVCNRGVYQATFSFAAAPLCSSLPFYHSLGQAGEPAPGAWICGSCGTANCDLTPNFCPACGTYRA